MKRSREYDFGLKPSDCPKGKLKKVGQVVVTGFHDHLL